MARASNKKSQQNQRTSARPASQAPGAYCQEGKRPGRGPGGAPGREPPGAATSHRARWPCRGQGQPPPAPPRPSRGAVREARAGRADYYPEGQKGQSPRWPNQNSGRRPSGDVRRGMPEEKQGARPAHASHGQRYERALDVCLDADLHPLTKPPWPAMRRSPGPGCAATAGHGLTSPPPDAGGWVGGLFRPRTHRTQALTLHDGPLFAGRGLRHFRPDAPVRRGAGG